MVAAEISATAIHHFSRGTKEKKQVGDAVLAHLDALLLKLGVRALATELELALVAPGSHPSKKKKKGGNVSRDVHSKLAESRAQRKKKTAPTTAAREKNKWAAGLPPPPRMTTTK